MYNRRLITALLIALLLAGGVALFLSRKFGGPTVAKPRTQKYVAASRAIQEGEELKAENLVLIDWPVELPLQGGFTKVEDLAGRSIIYPIAQSQPIVESYLSAPGSGIGLTVKIPEGMRAVSLRSDEIVGVAGFLFPGSHVDVLLTFRTEEQKQAPATQIVLQDVQVLTVGQKLQPDPQGKPEKVTVVTVLLSPEDAQKVVLAGTLGTIQFVLRNGADREHVKAVPVQMAQVMGAAPVPKASSIGRPRPAKEPYVVETILGNKRTTNRFEP